jgi:hypothetical protein
MAASWPAGSVRRPPGRWPLGAAAGRPSGVTTLLPEALGVLPVDVGVSANVTEWEVFGLGGDLVLAICGWPSVRVVTRRLFEAMPELPEAFCLSSLDAELPPPLFGRGLCSPNDSICGKAPE